MKIIKYGVKRALSQLNLEIRRTTWNSDTEETYSGADPVTFQYLADSRVTPWRKIDLRDARAGIMGYALTRSSSHPLVAAFQLAKTQNSSDRRGAVIRDVLSKYYRLVQPASALDILDLTIEDAPGLADVPLHSWVMPWSERGIAETAAHRKICLEEEGLAHRIHLSVRDGATFYGPVSSKKLDLEVLRVSALTASMLDRGYQSRWGQIPEVVGLRCGVDYRWLIVQGQHRMAACAAFELSEVETKIMKIIRREDCVYWPQVVSKVFTVRGALKCFDRLFSGDIPRFCRGSAHLQG